MANSRGTEQTGLVYGEAVSLAVRLTPLEGYNQTLVADVTVLRRSRSTPRSPVVYEPSIIFVVQGRKVDYLGGLKLDYEPRTVLVLSAPIPFECVIEANQAKPLLSVVVRLRREVVLSILSEMHDLNTMRSLNPKAILTATLDEELSSALTRLLKAAISPDDARVLGDQTVRELIYLVLKGPGGDGIRAMLDVDGAFAQILSALQRIHNEYGRPLIVAELARHAGMSVSAFHLHFKRVTSTSPIQYVKAVRMHKAQSLLLSSNVTAGSAGTRVGYSSASQFGRDFKRFFGMTPARIVETHRETGRAANTKSDNHKLGKHST